MIEVERGGAFWYGHDGKRFYWKDKWVCTDGIWEDKGVFVDDNTNERYAIKERQGDDICTIEKILKE